MNNTLPQPLSNDIGFSLNTQFQSQSMQRYKKHLDASIKWLDKSFLADTQGSHAYLWAFGQWKGAYPETTGYIIATLLEYASLSGEAIWRNKAIKLGDWLLSIQEEEGYWHGLTHPAKSANPSVFNTAQILIGLCALYRETKNNKWLESIQRASTWLAEGVNEQGQWMLANYQGDFNPSYYTRVTWPMLEAWSLTGEQNVHDVAVKVLEVILATRKDNGVFSGWGFKPDAPAFTHTIAYTLRGFMESARLLGSWEPWGKQTEAALNTLLKKAELSSGSLAGSFTEDWKGDKSYVCLTGNAQLAICFLKLYEREDDLRLVNAAAKLVDTVCAKQNLNHPIPIFNGAVAGSSPIWGAYMKGRYPNWAAKFHADALMLLMQSLDKAELK